jgi:flagellar hook protein FlgE
MSLFGNMYVSYTGLYTDTIGLQVVSNNISNLNTVGFKMDRTEFADRVAREMQVFTDEKLYGSSVKDIRTLFTQGGINTTDNPTDLAISGKGFFIVSDEEGNLYYTRDGQFFVNEADENHFALQNSLGMYLLGASPDTTEATLDTLQPYLIPKVMDPQGTSSIKTELIFDSRKATNDRTLLDKYAYDPDNPSTPLEDGEYDWVWELPIYDTAGNAINLRLYADRGSSPDEYEILVALEDPTLDGRGDGQYKGAFLYGTLTFGASGEITGVDFSTISPDGTLSPVEWSDGHPSFTLNINGNTQDISLDLGFTYDPNTGTLERTDNTSRMLASSFAQLYYNQDGYPMGIFDRIEVITEEGLIRAWYTNNKDIDVSKIFLADFTGYEDSLKKIGNNLFKASPDVTPFIFAPSSSARGRIISGALENSNVDLASEMVNLIMLQRAFQSNSRVITTSDELLQDFLRQV